jgi:hypothetical protein
MARGAVATGFVVVADGAGVAKDAAAGAFGRPT